MQQRYKAMYKWELAEQAGVTLKTFRAWLKRDNLTGIVPKEDKILSPEIVKMLCEKYVIVFD